MPNRNTPSPYKNRVCEACVEVTMHKAGVCMQCIESGLEWASNPQNIVDLVGLAHTPQFCSDYHRFLAEWFGYEPEFNRFDDRHIAPAQAFFDDINNVETDEFYQWSI